MNDYLKFIKADVVNKDRTLKFKLAAKSLSEANVIIEEFMRNNKSYKLPENSYNIITKVVNTTEYLKDSDHKVIN